MEGTYFKILMAIYNKPMTSIILNGQRLSVPSEIRCKARRLTVSAFIQYHIRIPGYRKQANIISQRNLTEFERNEVKVSLFEDDMIIFK